MANFQKHAGSPASSRHVVVVAMTNWLLRLAKEFVDGLPGSAWSKGILRASMPLTNCLALSEHASLMVLLPIKYFTALTTSSVFFVGEG